MGKSKENVATELYAEVVCLANVPPQRTKWLAKNRIPKNKLTLFCGNPNEGKTFIAIDLCSCVSKGFSWPHRTRKTKKGDCIILSAEDAPDDVLRPRLDACGADVKRVHILTGIRKPEDPESLSMFSLEEDLRHLEDVLNRKRKARLVIIDPLSGYLGAGVDAHVDADVRRVLAPLSALAARRNVAVLGIQHLNKSASQMGSVLYRAMGSIGFAAAARAVWMIAPDLDNPTRKLFLLGKCNLAADPGGLAYRIVAPGRVVWERGKVSITATEALAPDKSFTQRDRAVAFLRRLLQDGPVKQKVVESSAENAGIKLRTLRRAANALKVVKRPVEPKSEKEKKYWVWGLPKE